MSNTLSVTPYCTPYYGLDSCTAVFTQTGSINADQLAVSPSDPLIDFEILGAAGGAASSGTAGGEGGEVNQSFTLPSSWENATFDIGIGGVGGNGSSFGGGAGGAGGGGIGSGASGGAGSVGSSGGGGGASWVTVVDSFNANSSGQSVIGVGPGGGGGGAGGNQGGAGGQDGNGSLQGGPDSATTTSGQYGTGPAYCAGAAGTSTAAGAGGDCSGAVDGASGSGSSGGAGASLDEGGLYALATDGAGGGGGGLYGGGGGAVQDSSAVVALEVAAGAAPAGGGGGGGGTSAAEAKPGPAEVVVQWYTDATTQTGVSLSSPTATTNGTVTATADVTSSVSGTNPTGAVQFEVDGNPSGAAVPVGNFGDWTGTATITLAGLPAGSDSISAVYSPSNGSGLLVGSTSAAASLAVSWPTETPWSFMKAPTSYGLDLELNLTDGGVDIWQQVMSGSNVQANEVWNYEPIGNGYGQLVNDISGNCLEVNGSTGAVDTWACVPGAENELWKLVPNTTGSDGGTALQVMYSGEYLALNVSDPTFSDGAALDMQASMSNFTSWAATEQG
jgi:hypothetical protein